MMLKFIKSKICYQIILAIILAVLVKTGLEFAMKNIGLLLFAKHFFTISESPTINKFYFKLALLLDKTAAITTIAIIYYFIGSRFPAKSKIMRGVFLGILYMLITNGISVNLLPLSFILSFKYGLFSLLSIWLMYSFIGVAITLLIQPKKLT